MLEGIAKAIARLAGGRFVHREALKTLTQTAGDFLDYIERSGHLARHYKARRRAQAFGDTVQYWAERHLEGDTYPR
jgi:hypothetical protein